MNVIVLYLNIVTVALTSFVALVLLITIFKNREKLFLDPAPKKFPSISIAVPAYNEEKNIAKTIQHLLALDYPKKPEIIVVNDGSSDNTAAIAKKFKGVQLINKKINQGKARALNDALKIAKGEIFGFIDAETFIARSALKNLIGYFNKKNIGAVIPAIYVHKPTRLIEKLQEIEYAFAILMRKTLTFLNALFLTPGCAFYRKNLLKKIGGFDEHTLSEDLEIGLRINKAGFFVENSVNVRVETVAPRTLRGFMCQRIRWFRGLLHNIRKYRKMFLKKSDLGIFVLPFIMLGSIAVILLYAMLVGISISNIIYNAWVGFVGFVLSDFTVLSDVYFEPNVFVLFSIFLLAIYIVNIYFSERVSGIRIFSRIIYVALFLFIYSPLLCVAWIVAITKEIFGAERKW